MSKLLELAERCGKATRPDRRFDHEIYEELGLSGGRSVYRAPTYTASIDAALRLVPEGHVWRMSQEDAQALFRRYHAELKRGFQASYDKVFNCWAASPALALCAAALRARAAAQGQDHG